MSGRACHTMELDRLRSYSSVFTRSVFSRLVKFDDFTAIDQVGKIYDGGRCSKEMTYSGYLDWMYLMLSRGYRNEYVYKNTLVNKIVSLNKARNVVVFNEFRVGDSIADVATFNGKSCVYEIKTELDSPKRLAGQAEDYLRFFQECYVVVPADLADEYLSVIDDRMGVYTMTDVKGCPSVKKFRPAVKLTDNLDVDVLMRVLWISEYEHIVKVYFGQLPDVGYYEMFGACWDLIRKIPVDKLSKMVVEEIKRRKNNPVIFDNGIKSLTQICLAMNFNQRQYAHLLDNLNRTINF